MTLESDTPGMPAAGQGAFDAAPELLEPPEPTAFASVEPALPAGEEEPGEPGLLAGEVERLGEQGRSGKQGKSGKSRKRGKRSRKHARRRAREAALALLYSSDIMGTDAWGIAESGAYPADNLSMSAYAEALVQGVCAKRADIDRRLATSSDNWALERMPAVDRAILRVAVYEMLYVRDVPVSVAINEAVELAKLYGGEDDSSKFVNGVLGRIARASGEAADVAEGEAGAAGGSDAPDAPGGSDAPDGNDD